MRVLMICPELPSAKSAGSMAPAARQIESLRDLGLKIDVIDMRGPPVLKYLLSLGRVRKIAQKADLVHCHFGYCGWLGRLGTWFGPKRPLVMSFMGDDLLGTPYNADGELEWFSKVMVRANKSLARRMTQVIVKSPEMAEVLHPISCTVVPNGVDTDLFRPLDRLTVREELGLSPSKKYVLFPGNPDNPRKGFELASQAVKLAESSLAEPIEILKLWDIEPKQVPRLMNAVDGMLMTSLIEGSPNVVKEALACNTAIVGVPVGDVEHLLAGVSNCHVRPRDPQQVSSALLEVLGKHSDGRAAIEQRGLDLKSVAERIADIYRLAIEGQAASSTSLARSNPSEAFPSAKVGG